MYLKEEVREKRLKISSMILWKCTILNLNYLSWEEVEKEIFLVLMILQLKGGPRLCNILQM